MSIVIRLESHGSRSRFLVSSANEITIGEDTRGVLVTNELSALTSALCNVRAESDGSLYFKALVPGFLIKGEKLAAQADCQLDSFTPIFYERYRIYPLATSGLAAALTENGGPSATQLAELESNPQIVAVELERIHRPIPLISAVSYTIGSTADSILKLCADGIKPQHARLSLLDSHLLIEELNGGIIPSGKILLSSKQESIRLDLPPSSSYLEIRLRQRGE